MHRLRELWALLLFVAPWVWGCEQPQERAVRQQAAEARVLLTEAERLIAQGDGEAAAKVAQRAALMLSNDPGAYLIVFEAQTLAGNATAAALALKQAADLNSPSVKPQFRKQLAELYRLEGRRAEAISVLSDLLQRGHLQEEDIVGLARLQTYAGDSVGAFRTLEQVQEANPDHPEAKVVEAEALMARGDESLATKLLDRLVEENPSLVSARLARARYFYGRDHVGTALEDLEQLQGAGAQGPEVVELKARALNRLARYADAEALLKPVVAKNPRDARLLALLAETLVYQRRVDDAYDLLERALAMRPKFARALYVRGRARSLEGDAKGAREDFEAAVAADVTFGPALSALWPLQRAAGESAEAMETLERLLETDEATTVEKVALVELYIEARRETGRSLRLIREARRRDPANRYYVSIETQLEKTSTREQKQRGIRIIRGPRRH
ncbi:MAG: tetratricopeptide repeat protein [Myxococcaceae bacterium]